MRLAIAPFFVGDKDAPRFVLPGRFPHDESNRMELLEVNPIEEENMAIIKYKLNRADK
jgi:5-amino-6-(5-phosphoribosylamino)uracil reductase